MRSCRVGSQLDATATATAVATATAAGEPLIPPLAVPIFHFLGPLSTLSNPQYALSTLLANYEWLPEAAPIWFVWESLAESLSIRVFEYWDG